MHLVEMWRRVSKRGSYAAVAALCIVVSGCAQTEYDDLNKFVEDTRNSQKGRIDPLPQFKPFETFAYNASNLRPPFSPWKDESAATKIITERQACLDYNRRKELLEKFPLDSLRMVGTMAREDGHWAIIRAPDGMVYRAKEGNFMGQNHGKIVKLTEQRIELMECVPDGLGGLQERPASMNLEG